MYSMGTRKRIGEKLIEAGFITEEQLNAALAEQKKSGELLGAILFGFRLGSVPLANPDEGRYAEIPREMLASGVPFVAST